jgi:hypothetical protein
MVKGSITAAVTGSRREKMAKGTHLFIPWSRVQVQPLSQVAEQRNIVKKNTHLIIPWPRGVLQLLPLAAEEINWRKKECLPLHPKVKRLSPVAATVNRR